MRALCRLQACWNSQKQRIGQHIPQPRERMTDRRLREKKTSRRSGDVALFIQDIKNPQQIEVDFHMNQLDDVPDLYALA